MPELTLRLCIDPETGKKTLVADYHSDQDALPDEHEEEHRRWVQRLLEGASTDGGSALGGGTLSVTRATEAVADIEREDGAAEAEAQRTSE